MHYLLTDENKFDDSEHKKKQPFPHLGVPKSCLQKNVSALMAKITNVC
jgi:hypothetical protein